MAPHYHLLVSAKYLNETADCGYNCPDPSPLSPAPAPSPAAVVRAAAPAIPPLPPPPMYASNKHQLLRTLVIVVASVVATCALLLTYYAVLRRYRSLRRRRATAAEAEAEAEQPQPPSDTDDELRQDLLVGGALDEPYHVWHIRTAGLDERTIGAISAVAYRRGEGLVEGTDCAVCLGEFRDGEMLRLLPKCSHAFHIPCIDTWLRSHLNCPLCRAPILSPPPRSPPHAADANSASSSSPSSAVAAAAAGPGAGQSAAATAAGGNSPVHRTSHRHVMPEEEGEDGIIAAVGPPPALAVAGHQLGSSFSHEESEAWVRIDLGNGGPEDDDGRTRSNAPPAEDGGNGRAELQQVQRSISMDPSALGALLRRMGLVGIAGEDSYRRKPTSEEHPTAAKEGGRRGNNCRGTPLTDAGPPEMPRSMSSSGGRFFLSRFSGRSRGSPFPL